MKKSIFYVVLNQMRLKDVFLATACGKMSEKDGRFSTMQQNNLYFEPKYPTSSGADCLSLSNHHLLFERKAMDTVKRKAGKRAIRTVVPMLFLLLASCLHAQDRQYKFRLIDASDGLSDGQIRSLTMTEEGCIAIKTGFILNIYNGATFDRFPYDKTRKYIWAYDRPPKEYYDREGRMWLKELGYLLLLDMKSGQYDYSVSEVLASMGINRRLKNLFIDDYKNYWFVTEDNTVSFYDVEQGRLRTIEDGGSEFTRKYGVPVEMTQYKNLC